MKENACQFGEQGRLNGIVTQSANQQSDTALILISAGLTAKVGPYRLYTQLAREAAWKNITTLRFDLGGIGNSEQVYAGYPLKVRTQLDIAAAVDYLESAYAVKRFVVGGLCSGAEDALRYAYEDKRVTGVLLLDGHAYLTKGVVAHKTTGRRFLIRSVGLVLRKLRFYKLLMGSSEESSLEGVQGGLVDYKQMEPEESTQILNSLLDRNTKFHYVYTRRFRHSITRKEQFDQMFPDINFKNLATVSCLPHMEHTQVFEEDRNELIQTICNWLSDSFSEEPAEL